MKATAARFGIIIVAALAYLPTLVFAFTVSPVLKASVNADLSRTCIGMSRDTRLNGEEGAGAVPGLLTTRRSLVSGVFTSSIVWGITSAGPAFASGGATAGGPYLLSAKQRYNKRVVAGMKSFLSLSADVEKGDLSSTKAFFAGEDEGSWKDGSSAGYLLANAFRTSSATPPDNLPAVKKWKAFAVNVSNMEKAVKKKKSSDAANSYKLAVEALDAYLEEVELPAALEL